MRVPHASFLYADTFALCWGNNLNSSRIVVNDYTATFRFSTIFDEELFTTTSTSKDSLTVILFDKSYNTERAFYIHCVFRKESVKAIVHQEVVVKFLSRDPKLELLRSLVATNANVVNLQLLADAYESAECYANAYYVYSRMFSIDHAEATRSFDRFFRRNFVKLNPLSRSDR
jgi:hypothetical protein